jgi:glutathione S-transferase
MSRMTKTTPGRPKTARAGPFRARMDLRTPMRYESPMTVPTLLYFHARGRAELIRLVLAEAGVEYTEHHVGKGTPPANGRPTDLAELKAAGVLPFGAVPVWEEPGLRLAQSAAIAAHLARRHGLLPADPGEAARCDELLGAVDDVRLEVRRLATAAPEKRAEVRAELERTTLPRWLGDLERLVGPRLAVGGLAVGRALTLADLALWYLLELLKDNDLGVALERCPALSAFFGRIAARPRIAAYLASARRPAFTPLPR